MKPATVLVAAACIAVAGGCGSATRTTRPPFYSSHRVTSAFARQGVSLHMAPGACAKGFVCLAGAAGRVQVYVFDGHTSSLLAYAAGRSVRETEKANVTVVWDRRYGKQVRSALSRL